MSATGGTQVTAPAAGGAAGAVLATSGNVAAAPAVATMPAVPGKTNFVTGFEITGAGATAASVVVATFAGLAQALAYVVAVPAGAAVGITPIVVEFSQPVPASAANTAVSLTLPSLGAGNTNAAVNLHGYAA